MNFAGMVRGLAVCLAVAGFCLPQPLFAAVQSHQSPAVTDVALQDGPQGNVLIGRVLDQEGAAQARTPVTLYGGGKKLAEIKTDGNGYFTFSNLRGGVYQLTAAEGVGAFRVWTPRTAPPSAQPGALVIVGKDVVRGQWHPFRHGFGNARFWFSHPLFVAGAITAAVAIPVAIHNCKSKSP